MKKELLEESTKTRWKKIAGINEGWSARRKQEIDMYNRLAPQRKSPDTSIQDTEKKLYSRYVPLATQAIEKIGLQLSPEDINAVVYAVLENRSSHEQHKDPPSPITKHEILRNLKTLKSVKKSPLDKGYRGESIYKISDDGLSQLEALEQREKERLAALEEPLTPEEEAALQPADKLPSRSTVEMPGEKDPEAIAAAQKEKEEQNDLSRRGMFGVSRPGVAENKKIRIKYKNVKQG